MSSTQRLLDPGVVRRNFDRASATYDESAVMQARVRQQLIDRLEWIAFEPEVVVDLGCGTGHAARALGAKWPAARVIAVDFAPGMLREAVRQDVSKRCEHLCADALALPLPDASVDLLFSNLMLAWCDELDLAFAEIARVLRPRGLLTFSTFGPDTLMELHEAWNEADDYSHVMPFADMHDIGDGLIRAGLVEPVLDVVRYTLTYPDVFALMRDLKAIGSQNATTGRPRGLTGRQRLHTVEQTYEHHRRDGQLPANYEIVFAQAWGGVDHPETAFDGEFTVPVSTIQRRVGNY
ncbi:MAG: malonyl-ACP O-methyltransferase BioC [Steroidobacteraceae bacterium]